LEEKANMAQKYNEKAKELTKAMDSLKEMHTKSEEFSNNTE
jgi:hypothetical protein